MIFRLLGLLNTNISNDTNIFSRGSYSVFNTHTDLTDHTDIVRGGALTGGLNTRFFEHELNELNEYYLHAEARSAMLTFEC